MTRHTARLARECATTRASRRRMATLFCLALLSPAPLARAQSLGAGVAWLGSSNDLVRGGPGPDVALSIPLPRGATMVLGVAAMRHGFPGRESTCWGLRPPGTPCPEEPTTHDAVLGLGRLALELPLLRWRTGGLSLGPEVVAGYGVAFIRGGESENTFHDGAPHFGVGAAASLRHRPRGGPLAIVLGGGAARTRNPWATTALDDYRPLDARAVAWRATLGVAVDFRAGREGSVPPSR